MLYVLPPPIHPANAIRGSHLLMEVQHHTALLGWVGVWVLWMAHRVQQPGRQVRRLVEGPWRGIRGMVPRPLFQPRPPWRLLAEGWVALRGSRVAVVLIVVAWQWAVVGVQVVGVMVVMMGVGVVVVVVVMIVVVAVVVVVVVVVVGVVVVVVMAGQAVSPATLASHWRAAVKKRRRGGGGTGAVSSFVSQIQSRELCQTTIVRSASAHCIYNAMLIQSRRAGSTGSLRAALLCCAGYRAKQSSH